MITQLRSRTRADRFLNDVRANQKKRRNYGRYVYLATVLAVMLYLANLFVGHYFWLRAEGLVLSDRVVIASPYEVQVTDLFAHPGQHVAKGQMVARVSSPQIASAMANLTARSAETHARYAEMAVRFEVADSLLKRAEERLAETEAQLKKVDAARGASGFVSDAFIASVSKDRYAAMQEKVSREAERRASQEQMTRLQQSQDEAKQALDHLRATYNDGAVLAPSDGIVGATVVTLGDVVKPGDHLMEVYTGPRYAYVYLDTGTLYRAEVGDRVEVADGFNGTKGTVAEILPLTVPLPNEFQKAFRPPARGQVAKIRLDDERLFPLASKIAVTSDKLMPGNDAITRKAVAKKIHSVLRTAWESIDRLIAPSRSAAHERVRTVAGP